MPRKYIRKTGEAARALSSSYRRRLREFRTHHASRLGVSSLSIPQLKLCMQAPFTWETLKRALAGKALRADNCQFIEQFLDKHAALPSPLHAALDRKSISAGEHEYEETTPQPRLDRDLVSKHGYKTSSVALSPKHSVTEEEIQECVGERDCDVVAEITHRGSR